MRKKWASRYISGPGWTVTTSQRTTRKTITAARTARHLVSAKILRLTARHNNTDVNLILVHRGTRYLSLGKIHQQFQLRYIEHGGIFLILKDYVRHFYFHM